MAGTVRTIVSMLNFQNSYAIATRNAAFLTELNWMKQEITTLPANALFIPYAYNGTNYPAYFQECATAIGQNGGPTLTDINSGVAQTLLPAAQMLMIGGGDIGRFITAMNGLINATFNPWNVIKTLASSGVPIITWNEGAALMSPLAFTLPSGALTKVLNISPSQIVNNYTRSTANELLIKAFLQNSPAVTQVIALTSAAAGIVSAGRIEDTGSGTYQTRLPGYPTVIDYTLSGGNLVAS